MNEKEEIVNKLAQKICDLLFDEGFSTSIETYWLAQKFILTAEKTVKERQV